MVNFVIMKKLYIQPQTENVRLDSGMIMTQLGQGSDASNGMWGAPTRRGNPAAVMYI